MSKKLLRICAYIVVKLVAMWAMTTELYLAIVWFTVRMFGPQHINQALGLTVGVHFVAIMIYSFSYGAYWIPWFLVTAMVLLNTLRGNPTSITLLVGFFVGAHIIVWIVLVPFEITVESIRKLAAYIFRRKLSRHDMDGFLEETWL